MDRKILRVTAILSVIILLSCAVSCMGHRPDLQRLFWQLDVYRTPENGAQYERLSVFAVVRDMDGGEDLDVWRLRMPEEELVWERDVEELRRVGSGEDTWTGSNSFAMPFDAPLPRGEYLLHIADRAGEQGETSFIIPADLIGLTSGDLEVELFPRLRFENGRALLSSSYEHHSITVVDARGEIVELSESSKALFPAGKLEEWRNAGGEELVIGAFHEELGIGLKSGPYPLPPVTTPDKPSAPERSSASENAVE